MTTRKNFSKVEKMRSFEWTMRYGNPTVHLFPILILKMFCFVALKNTLKSKPGLDMYKSFTFIISFL